MPTAVEVPKYTGRKTLHFELLPQPALTAYTHKDHVMYVCVCGCLRVLLLLTPLLGHLAVLGDFVQEHTVDRLGLGLVLLQAIDDLLENGVRLQSHDCCVRV